MKKLSSLPIAHDVNAGAPSVFLFPIEHYKVLYNRRVAFLIPWPHVTAILGRPHNGSVEDHNILTEALRVAGAPSWIETAEGWIDADGWGLHPFRPKLVAEHTVPQPFSADPGSNLREKVINRLRLPHIGVNEASAIALALAHVLVDLCGDHEGGDAADLVAMFTRVHRAQKKARKGSVTKVK